MNIDREVTRKNFFKEGPRSLLRAFFQGANESSPSQSVHKVLTLRPPGAAPEVDFLDLCVGTGACATACPANAIQMVPLNNKPGRFGPVIRPSESPCVLCDDLSCMKACPSGALTLVPREMIRIGAAEINPDECWAWSKVDESCSHCVDRCPVGPAALRMVQDENGAGPFVETSCTGCGVCEFHCPVYPAAIYVTGLTATSS